MICERIRKKCLLGCSALCIKVFFLDQTTFFNNDAYFLDLRAQKLPLIFFNVNPF